MAELLKLLDDLELTGNTLVIFAGDNGSAASGSLDGHAVPKGKGRTVDLGVHVPFIVRAPMFCRGGRVSGALTDFTDLLPTFAELAGAKPPDGVKPDGRSLVPLLKGAVRDEEHRAWIFSQLGNTRMVRDGQYELKNTGALYDLKDDPTEEKDLRDRADPALVAARERLAKVLDGLPPDADAPFEGYRGEKKDANPARAKKGKRKET